MTENYSMRLSARRSYISELSETKRDFIGSLAKFQLSFSLAMHDVTAKYRGSILGPWWITLTMGALILGIGFNYAGIFHTSPKELLPYVAVGIVMWNFISGCISDGGESFIVGGAMLRQTALPLPLFVMRSFIRNLVNLGHHIIIVVLVLFYIGHFPGVGLAWALLGFALTCLNLMWIMLLVAFLATRFRDVPQIITAVLQIMLFLSPIFWRVNDATATSPFVKYNPVYYSIESIRQPVLDGAAPISFYGGLALAALIGWIVALASYNQTRRRVIHYL